MKLIRCSACGDPVALSRSWRNCECGMSGGAYGRDGDQALVAGPCGLYGISNEVFYGVRSEAWPYDEANGKITRLTVNPSDFPDRLTSAAQGTARNQHTPPRTRTGGQVDAPRPALSADTGS